MSGAGDVRDRHLLGVQGDLPVTPVEASAHRDHRVGGQHGGDGLISLGEEEHLDASGQVLDLGDGPQVALLGGLAGQGSDEPGDGDHGAVRQLIVLVELGDLLVRELAQQSLQAHEGVVGDVEAQHVALVGELVLLVPLRQVGNVGGEDRAVAEG